MTNEKGLQLVNELTLMVLTNHVVVVMNGGHEPKILLIVRSAVVALCSQVKENESVSKTGQDKEGKHRGA